MIDNRLMSSESCDLWAVHIGVSRLPAMPPDRDLGEGHRWVSDLRGDHARLCAVQQPFFASISDIGLPITVLSLAGGREGALQTIWSVLPDLLRISTAKIAVNCQTSATNVPKLRNCINCKQLSRTAQHCRNKPCCATWGCVTETCGRCMWQ